MTPTPIPPEWDRLRDLFRRGESLALVHRPGEEHWQLMRSLLADFGIAAKVAGQDFLVKRRVAADELKKLIRLEACKLVPLDQEVVWGKTPGVVKSVSTNGHLVFKPDGQRSRQIHPLGMTGVGDFYYYVTGNALYREDK